MAVNMKENGRLLISGGHHVVLSASSPPPPDAPTMTNMTYDASVAETLRQPNGTAASADGDEVAVIRLSSNGTTAGTMLTFQVSGYGGVTPTRVTTAAGKIGVQSDNFTQWDSPTMGSVFDVPTNFTECTLFIAATWIPGFTQQNSSRFVALCPNVGIGQNASEMNRLSLAVPGWGEMEPLPGDLGITRMMLHPFVFAIRVRTVNARQYYDVVAVHDAATPQLATSSESGIVGVANLFSLGSTDQIRIGHEASGVGVQYHEVKFYNSALSDTDTLATFVSLRTKWGAQPHDVEGDVLWDARAPNRLYNASNTLISLTAGAAIAKWRSTNKFLRALEGSAVYAVDSNGRPGVRDGTAMQLTTPHIPLYNRTWCLVFAVNTTNFWYWYGTSNSIGNNTVAEVGQLVVVSNSTLQTGKVPNWINILRTSDHSVLPLCPVPGKRQRTAHRVIHRAHRRWGTHGAYFPASPGGR